MVNQIIVASKQNNKVILANSVDSGSNEFILRWLCDLHRIPRIIIGGETYIPTSEDYMLKIPATMWTGSSYFLVTIKDTRATTELKIYRIADTEGNISMRIMGDNTYRLMKVTSGEAGEYDNFLSETSINAVQNKVITEKINEIEIDISDKVGVIYGETNPNDNIGNNKDFYLKYKDLDRDILTSNGWEAPMITEQYPIELVNFVSLAHNKFNFDIIGTAGNSGNGRIIKLYLYGLEEGNEYQLNLDFQFASGVTFDVGHANYISISGNTAITNITDDTSRHSYSIPFTYTEGATINFYLLNIEQNCNFTAYITNFEFIGEWSSNITDIYNKKDGRWKRYTGSGGGSAVQSDWTQTDPNADDYIKNKPTLGTASEKDYTTSVTENDANLVTSGAVYSAISDLPKSMIFKGTLGTNGTITILPSASTLNEGYTYKVITAGTYASQSAKVGDVFTSNSSEWVLIPSGDETDTDTWRNINVNGSEVLGNGISSGGLDFINGTGLNAIFNSTGNTLQFNVDTDNLAPAFTEASTRTNIATGEKLSILFGKIKKFFGDLKTVAFSGSYNDLTDKPTIPTVNNATLTIQKNGTQVQTFTANQSTNATANITVPTKVSELTNDSGYVTANNKVTQTNTTGNADYRVLFSENANDTTQTVGARKNTSFKYNPSTGNLQVTKLNGVTVGSSPKFTDTTYNFSGTTFYSGNNSNAEHNANNCIKNGLYYYNSNGPGTDIFASGNDGALYVQAFSDSYVAQIAQDYRSGRTFVRGRNNGTWTAWGTPIYNAGSGQGAIASMVLVVASNYIHCTCGAGAYGITVWTSDTKLKKNIEDTIITALDKIADIRFIQFDWKAFDKHERLGVSANQIEEIMPDAVYDVEQPKDSEYKTLKNIDTCKMTTYALKGIQELYELVKQQQKEIDTLKSEIEALKRR